jgi:hypothetical protein
VTQSSTQVSIQVARTEPFSFTLDSAFGQP